ncbi:uncharacterized protein EI97DRAFT_176273 [Westerdykella ornata]|uniref:Uncharacterized protein n=1 Tax=Westerdykella ornata TaxID=318751 RepID=A0A6A6JWJ4_WESOR|nr:uncharacterized protein EI97DRAFT_176273 [Westerdykella ornata]KAF2279439.1 hypothetical protein EI97DRAFT_176273 [Westerdykella ornata]
MPLNNTLRPGSSTVKKGWSAASTSPSHLVSCDERTTRPQRIWTHCSIMGNLVSTPLPNSRPLAWPIESLETYRASLDADDLLKVLVEDFSGCEAVELAASGLAALNDEETVSRTMEGPQSQYDEWLPSYADLLEHGYIEFPAGPRPEYCKTSDWYIHPVLEKSKWERLAIGQKAFDVIYDRIRPALALVTRFLSIDEANDWWLHVLNGQIVQETSGNKRVYFAPGEHTRDLEAALTDLSAKLRFVWMALPECTGTMFHTPYDVLATMDREEWEQKRREHHDEYSPVIGLSSVYLYHLLRPLSKAKNLRLQICLAGTIGHELAHAFYSHVHGAQYHEVYHNPTDFMPEMGYSWEQHVFGCILSLRNIADPGIGPVRASSVENLYASPSISKPMTMEWVEKWFLLETWQVENVTLPRTQPVETYENPGDYSGAFWAEVWNAERGVFEERLYLYVGTPDARTGKSKRKGANQKGTPTLSIRDWWLGNKNNPARPGKRDRHIQRALAAGYPKENIQIGRPECYRNQCYDTVEHGNSESA